VSNVRLIDRKVLVRAANTAGPPEAHRRLLGDRTAGNTANHVNRD
jgi:hypothetical protein